VGPIILVVMNIARISPISMDEKPLASRKTGKKGTTKPNILKYQK
jgi:hypothetical protein